MLVLRANAIAKGFSGVRPVVAETLCAMLNAGVHPVIPSQGSVGASGDLAPLAHLAQVAIGEGEAIFQGRAIFGGDAMRGAGIAPLALEAKEGLALLNGTQAMLALLALGLRNAEMAVDTADVAAALSLDALRGSPAAFDEKIAAVRPYAGHAITARNLRRLNHGSTIRESHRSTEKDKRVQDAYSLRCTPQVHGAVRDTLDQVRATLSVELNSATDNPLVFADSGEVISGGNFHGQPLAMAADQLAVALATLAGISERCGAGQRNEDAGDATFRGFDSDVGKSGRLRFDGDGRRTENSADAHKLAQRARHRAALGVPRVGPAGALAHRQGSAKRVRNRARAVEDGGCGPVACAGHSSRRAPDRRGRVRQHSALIWDLLLNGRSNRDRASLDALSLMAAAPIGDGICCAGRLGLTCCLRRGPHLLTASIDSLGWLPCLRRGCCRCLVEWFSRHLPLVSRVRVESLNSRAARSKLLPPDWPWNTSDSLIGKCCRLH
jgi:hypothetical protein